MKVDIKPWQLRDARKLNASDISDGWGMKDIDLITFESIKNVYRNNLDVNVNVNGKVTAWSISVMDLLLLAQTATEYNALSVDKSGGCDEHYMDLSKFKLSMKDGKLVNWVAPHHYEDGWEHAYARGQVGANEAMDDYEDQQITQDFNDQHFREEGFYPVDYSE